MWVAIFVVGFVGVIGGIAIYLSPLGSKMEESTMFGILLLLFMVLLLLGSVMLVIGVFSQIRETEIQNQAIITEHNEAFGRFVADTFDSGRLPLEFIDSDIVTHDILGTKIFHTIPTEIAQKLADWLYKQSSDLELRGFLHKMRSGQIDLWSFV